MFLLFRRRYEYLETHTLTFGQPAGRAPFRPGGYRLNKPGRSGLELTMVMVLVAQATTS